MTALAVFNNHIIYESFVAETPLVNLRLLCDEEADYANPIKLSSQGREKLAAAITGLVIADGFSVTMAGPTQQTYH